MIILQRLGRGLGGPLYCRFFSAPVNPLAAAKLPTEDVRTESTTLKKVGSSTGSINNTKNPIVAAAFASLLQKDPGAKSKKSSDFQRTSNQTDEMIVNANSLNELLTIPSLAKVTRKQALKIVSIVAEWSSIKKVKLADFENDGRFVELCGLLGRTGSHTASELKNNQMSKMEPTHVDDLQTVLGITANDEAAKLIAGLTLPQMIKVMSSLAQKKKRSIPLLRSLSFNISSNSNRLNLKECGDLLYAMACLNYRDVVLTGRICADVDDELTRNSEKVAPVASILTSLSMLRYRDTAILDNLCNWIVTNGELCKPSHIGALLLTLATLNYEPHGIEQMRTKLVDSMRENDFVKPSDWLNVVWSLAILNVASEQQLRSVVSDGFYRSLQDERKGQLLPSTKIKLLNCVTIAKRVDESLGQLLTTHQSELFVPFEQSKEKRVLVTGMLDALKSLLPSENYVKINQSTTMGIRIDAECVLDSKCVPLAVDKEHPNGTRIAILVHDYHDLCQGPHPALNGMQAFATRLLEAAGYVVLSIPHTEFSTSDKLLKRIEYLQQKLKALVVSARPQ